MVVIKSQWACEEFHWLLLDAIEPNLEAYIFIHIYFSIDKKACYLNETRFYLFIRHQTGPEPEYHKVVSGFKTFHHDRPFHLMHSEG